MSDKWMTVVEAATTLRVHPRTIERRIAGGKIQSRRADDGLLQVLISLPDTNENAPDTALETVRELAADQVTLATGSASALVKFAQNDAIHARDELSNVRQDAGRARRSALAAWCIVAAMGLGVCVAVGWTAQTLTRAREDVRHADDTVRQLTEYSAKMEAETKRLQAERDNARQDAAQAKIQDAEASGKLAAYVEQAEKHPTSRPANAWQRVIAALAEP